MAGSDCSGKTCLLHMFSRNQFQEISPVTTKINTYVSNIEVEGKQVELTVVDTPGEIFRRLNQIIW